MSRSTAFALTVSLLAAGGAAAQESPLLAQIFGDHAVLQRDRPIAVWGRADAGEAVTVSLGDASAEARADDQGRWRATLPARPAGGPYALTARDASGGTETAADVLIGDVWLCSGQSNMELPVSRALNGPGETGASADDRIRLVTIQKDFDPAPQDEFRHPVRWAAAGPATVGDFSAACWFFAKDLRRTHDVPMGLISSNWGGSNIETWMSATALREQGYSDRLAILDQVATDPAAAHAAWGGQWQDWWSARSAERPWSPEGAGGWTPVPAMEPWEEWGVPALAAYNGMLWYRADIELTAEQAAQGARLSLGNVDEADQTWVNGRALGAGGSGDRLYVLPPGLLRAGRNTVVVNAYDTWAVGGLYGPAGKRRLLFDDGTSVGLDEGGWRYRLSSVSEGPPRAPWSSTSGLTTIGNAMIAPLHDYGLRGALWYQGESNTGEAVRYRALLTGMMADWRERFGAPDLPFLVVQLAGFGPPSSEPMNSGWPELRESQRLAVRDDDHAGLAVAVDLGDRWDIHPAQKAEVGRRLARAARRVVYGEAIPPSGPRPVSARREGAAVVVGFDDVTGELKTLSSDQAIGFELCGPGGANCRFATATAAGREVRIAVPDATAAAEVRFCWADSPVCNLVDGSGLPAGPFRETVR